MGPFCDEDTAIKRGRLIAEEVERYYWQQVGGGDPDAEKIERVPECLSWLMTVERLGMPYSGGLLEQPYHFIQDIEAASLGRARFERTREINRKTQENWEKTYGAR